ncbi:Os04g0447650, partial [Oryza sativa Japonica Group]
MVATASSLSRCLVVKLLTPMALARPRRWHSSIARHTPSKSNGTASSLFTGNIGGPGLTLIGQWTRSINSSISYIPEAFAEGREHEARVALGAPQLGGHEHLLPGGDEAAAGRLRDGLAERRLRAVQRRGVEVAEAHLQRRQRGAPFRLRRRRRRIRRAHADRRHGPPGAVPQGHLRYRR